MIVHTLRQEIVAIQYEENLNGDGCWFNEVPHKTWEYFAKAAIQEQDPEKLTHLIQQLYRALDEDKN